MADQGAPGWRDYEEIKQLKARYCRCVDTHDWAGLREVFADDAVFEYDAGRFEGGDTFVEWVIDRLGDAVSVHHVTSPEITFDDATHARAIWAMRDYVERPPVRNRRSHRGYGHYHESYVKTDRWRIASWRLTRLRVDTFTPVGEQTATSA